jgi:phosphohistidine phosphatase
MKIYLVQHGKQVSEEVDPKKPLSAEGRNEIEAVGKALEETGTAVSKIVHSTKLRAKQTAEILAKHLNPVKVKEHEKLGPLDPIEPLLGSLEDNMMVIGHLPYLNKLAGHLLAKNEALELIHFENGKVVCLVQLGEKWQVESA